MVSERALSVQQMDARLEELSSQYDQSLSEKMSLNEQLTSKLKQSEEQLTVVLEENEKLLRITRDVIVHDHLGDSHAGRVTLDASTNTVNGDTSKDDGCGVGADGEGEGEGEEIEGERAGEEEGKGAARMRLLEEAVLGARKHMQENAALRLELRRVAGELQAEQASKRRTGVGASESRKRLIEASVMIAALKGKQQVLLGEVSMLKEVMSSQMVSAVDGVRDMMSRHTRSAQTRIASEGELCELRAKLRAAESALDWERKRAENLFKRERDRANRERRHREELEQDSKRRELQATEYIRMAYGELGKNNNSNTDTRRVSPPQQYQHPYQYNTQTQNSPSSLSSYQYDNVNYHNSTQFHTPKYNVNSNNDGRSISHSSQYSQYSSDADFSSFSEWYKVIVALSLSTFWKVSLFTLHKSLLKKLVTNSLFCVDKID